MKIRGKVVAIMPAPSNLVITYDIDGKKEENQALCIAINDRGEIFLVDIGSNGEVISVKDVENFECVAWR